MKYMFINKKRIIIQCSLLLELVVIASIILTTATTTISSTSIDKNNKNNKDNNSINMEKNIEDDTQKQQSFNRNNNSPATTPTTTAKSSSSSSFEKEKPVSFFVLCLTDGNIVSVDAWTGIHQSVLTTDPLLQTHYNTETPTSRKEEGDDDTSSNTDFLTRSSSMMVLPGLDGKLYYRPQQQQLLSSPLLMENDSDNDGNKPTATKSTKTTMSSEAPPLSVSTFQTLPLTMDHLLQNPVRSCQPTSSTLESDETCGLLSAQIETSFVALSAQTGTVQWRSSTTTRNNNGNQQQQQQEQRKESVLLLQRKDHLLQYVQIDNGQQLWNVSLGNYQALDFDLSPIQESDDDTDLEKEQGVPILDGTEKQLLPAIIFQNNGQSVVAVHPIDGSVLWQQDVPSTLASVFGIAKGKWQTIPIITAPTTHVLNEDTALDTTITKSIKQEQEIKHKENQKNRISDLSEYERFIWDQYWSTLLSKDSHNHRHQKALPDRPMNPNDKDNISVEVNVDSTTTATALCWLDEYEQWGTCENYYDNNNNNNRNQKILLEQQQRQIQQSHFPLLTLPSKPPLLLSSGTYNNISIHSNGLLLSWQIIVTSILVMLLLATLIGRFWYIRKKAQWMVMYHSNGAKNGIITSSSSSNTADNNASIESSNNQLSTQQQQPIERSNSNDNAGNSTDGIPLVRYSRYTSEFQELRALGKGGFGSVFQCENTLDGRQYAIKKISIYSNSYQHFQQQLQLVLREVKILALLDHPNIVRYYTAWLEIEEHESTAQEGNIIRSDEDSTTTQGTFSRRHSFSSSNLFSNTTNEESKVDFRKRSSRDLLQLTKTRSSNPLGWNNGLDISDNSSLFVPRTRKLVDGHPSTEDFLIFEDSQEDNTPSKSGDEQDVNDAAQAVQQSIHLIDENATSLRNIDNTSVVEDLQNVASFKNNHDRDTITMRQTLFIQMQLCSQKTVAAFLGDSAARSGSVTSSNKVDIPKALRIFVQIADATAHVHECGLIHRDLKPTNCFMDDSCTTVKVGDFGLSRAAKRSDNFSTCEDPSVQDYIVHEDHTAGVGTRSYASPEQMSGSCYDASTDVYSLGMMLFELLYPMYTGMERYICFNKLREYSFPSDWEIHVGLSFPTVKDLLINMLCRSPSNRPSAENVTRHIQSILGEFTLMSLDEHHHKRPDIVLLRIVSDDRGNALQHVMELIQEESNTANASVDIVQYGMRSSTASEGRSASIMEFALQYKSNANSSQEKIALDLISKLLQKPEIIKARLISTSRDAVPS